VVTVTTSVSSTETEELEEESVNRPAVAIIAPREDTLATGVAAALRASGEPVLCLHPRSLVGRAVTVTSRSLCVAGWPVAGVLFRAHPEGPFSEDFRLEDQAFDDAEARAFWLAALNLEGVLALNRYGAEAWFESAGGTVWRRALNAAGVTVAPFGWGDVEGAAWAVWHPHVSAQRRPAPERATRRLLGTALGPDGDEASAVVVCGVVVSGRETATVRAAARALATIGLQIVEIVTDSWDRVVRVSPHPFLEDPESLECAIALVCSRYREHLRRR
jgi:hypothetical protein